MPQPPRTHPIRPVDASQIDGIIANFVFLRLVCPAVTSPHTHGLFNNPPTADAQRMLVLVSKLLINTATNVQFAKEEYMTPLNPFIEKNAPQVGVILQSFSTSNFKLHRAKENEDGIRNQAVRISSKQVAASIELLYYHTMIRQKEIKGMLTARIKAYEDCDANSVTLRFRQEAQVAGALLRVLDNLSNPAPPTQSDQHSVAELPV